MNNFVLQTSISHTLRKRIRSSETFGEAYIPIPRVLQHNRPGLQKKLHHRDTPRSTKQ